MGMKEYQISQNKPLKPCESIHLLPFQIDFNGETQLYPYIDLEKDTISFRGRKLVSETMKLPDNSILASLSMKENGFIPSIECTDLKLWYHDDIDPSTYSNIKRAVEYKDFSDLLE